MILKTSSEESDDLISPSNSECDTAQLHSLQSDDVTTKHISEPSSSETARPRAVSLPQPPHQDRIEGYYNNASLTSGGVYNYGREYAVMNHYTASPWFNYLWYNYGHGHFVSAFQGQAWAHAVPCTYSSNQYTPHGESYIQASTSGPVEGVNLRQGKSLYEIYQETSPNRLKNATQKGHSPLVDFVDDGTERVLLRNGPKRILEIFLGRSVLAEFVCVLEQSKHGAPILDEVRLPRFPESHAALKIMVAWMQHACWQSLLPMAVPSSLFAAITLAQTL